MIKFITPQRVQAEVLNPTSPSKSQVEIALDKSDRFVYDVLNWSNLYVFSLTDLLFSRALTTISPEDARTRNL